VFPWWGLQGVLGGWSWIPRLCDRLTHLSG
jgi:hypothetical protein